MSIITLHKYHGLGNDYLVLDPNQNEVSLQERKIKMLCQRNFGAGADGILYGPFMEDGKIKVFIYNPDGSETGHSGNGVRIFARYLKDSGYVSESEIVLTMPSGDVEVEFLDETESCMRVNMGKADFVTSSAPKGSFVHEMINEPLMFHGTLYNTTCLSVGNPNCVIMTEEVSSKEVKELGPYVENAAYFSERMNLLLCKVKAKNRLRIEIYERGAGYTLASGTGAAAAAAAVFRMGLTDPQMTVEMPGGELEVEIAADGTIFMTGDVKKIGTFMIAEDFFS